MVSKSNIYKKKIKILKETKKIRKYLKTKKQPRKKQNFRLELGLEVLDQFWI